jgi:hypothetical protein
MNDQIRDLSTTEIDAVAGGLQYNDNPQNYVVRPSPVDTGTSSYTWGVTQTGG